MCLFLIEFKKKCSFIKFLYFIFLIKENVYFLCFLVSLRWMKLPPVRITGLECAREVPYMRYGHTAVLLDDTIYLWGGRNDTEGACNVLYAFDVSK